MNFGFFIKPKAPRQIFPACVRGLKNGDFVVFEWGAFWKMSWSNILTSKNPQKLYFEERLKTSQYQALQDLNNLITLKQPIQILAYYPSHTR